MTDAPLDFILDSESKSRIGHTVLKLDMLM